MTTAAMNRARPSPAGLIRVGFLHMRGGARSFASPA